MERPLELGPPPMRLLRKDEQHPTPERQSQGDGRKRMTQTLRQA